MRKIGNSLVPSLIATYRKKAERHLAHRGSDGETTYGTETLHIADLVLMLPQKY